MWQLNLVQPEIKVLKLGRVASPFFISEITNIATGYRQCYSADPIADIGHLIENADSDADMQNRLKEQYWEYLQKTHVPLCKNLSMPVELGLVGEYPEVSVPPEEFTREKFDQWWEYNSHRETCEKFYGYLAMCNWISTHLEHESPFEHGSMTVQINNVSRSFLAQITRHRLSSFSVESQRYVGQGKRPVDFSLPDAYLASEEVLAKTADLFEQIGKLAEELKEKGFKNEDIRAIYPNAMCTSMVVTANFREWAHILELRTSLHAQAEIRYVAHQIWNFLSRTMPFIWDRYVYTDMGSVCCD
jgi:thymidylate synthase (FAD)